MDGIYSSSITYRAVDSNKASKRAKKIERNLSESYAFGYYSDRCDNLYIDIAVDGTIFGSFKKGITLSREKVFSYGGAFSEKNYIHLIDIESIYYESSNSSIEIFITNIFFAGLPRNRLAEAEIFCSILKKHINQ